MDFKLASLCEHERKLLSPMGKYKINEIHHLLATGLDKRYLIYGKKIYLDPEILEKSDPFT